MINSLINYRSIVFDCDGVILDSNKVKTRAFYEAALPYGESAAAALVAHHTANGGVSRYKKFAHFLEVIVPELACHAAGPGLEQLLASYATEVWQGLLTCDVAPGLLALREASPAARWLIVSGGDQTELRKVFAARGLAELFDGGIFGSPDSKIEILQREIDEGNILSPALFVGDNRYDHVAAAHFDIDFVFLRDWSEFKDYESYCAEHKLETLGSLRNLLPY